MSKDLRTLAEEKVAENEPRVRQVVDEHIQGLIQSNKEHMSYKEYRRREMRAQLGALKAELAALESEDG